MSTYLYRTIYSKRKKFFINFSLSLTAILLLHLPSTALNIAPLPVFKPILSSFLQVEKIPVLLPSRLGASPDANFPLYAGQIAIDKDGYSIDIYSKSGCPARSCYVGSVSGRTRSSITDEDKRVYFLGDGSGTIEKRKSSDGHDIYLKAGTCAAGCSDGTAAFITEGGFYVIGLKGADIDSMYIVANTLARVK